jgi:hypothetical protein
MGVHTSQHVKDKYGLCLVDYLKDFGAGNKSLDGRLQRAKLDATILQRSRKPF